MTIFMTVGTSALYENKTVGVVPRSRSRPQPSINAAKALQQDINTFFTLVSQGTEVEADFMNSLKSRLLEEHYRFWEQPDNYRFNPQNAGHTSAELSTTLGLIHRMKEDGTSFTPGRLVLVATATQDGRLAAAINAHVFEHARELGLLPASAPATVVELQEQGKRLDEVVAALEEATEPYVNAQRNIFNITGGFKGLIPSITVLAIRHGWELFYRHETRHEQGYLIEPLERVERIPPTAVAPGPFSRDDYWRRILEVTLTT